MNLQGIDFKKKQFRQFIKSEKQKFSEEELRQKSEKIFNQLEQLETFRKSSILAAYWSLPGEVNTHDFILRNYLSKTILLPCIVGDDIVFRQFTGMQNMVTEKRYKIPEPTGEPFSNTDFIELIIVPGIAFDKTMNRLGRGKAFYDRILPRLKACKIGVCFDFQYFDEIPAGDKDIKMDIIIYG